MLAQPEVSTYQNLSIDALRKSYATGIDRIHPAVLRLSEEQAARTFSGDAGAWSCSVLLGHVLDAEIAFVHRMRRTAAEDRPSFTLWQEQDFIKNDLYRGLSIADTLGALRSLQHWTASWLGTLPFEDFQRIGLHPQRGEQTLHTILAYSTWHLDHHTWFLDKKMKQLL